MSLRCELFGHKPPVDFGEHSRLGGGNYLTADGPPIIDGIGRRHFTLIGTCGRCGEPYKVGMIHGGQIAQHLQEPSHDNQ